MSDDINNRASKESRQSFLSSFDDVDRFLEASESVDDEGDNKTVDIEITTDLGSSTSIQSPTSPMPNLSKSFDSKRNPSRSYDPIVEELSESPSSPRDLPHSDTPLPHADTPLPNPDSHHSKTESSDDITVHQDSDSLNTEALKLMAGINNTSPSFVQKDDKILLEAESDDIEDTGIGLARPDIKVEKAEKSDSDSEPFLDCETGANENVKSLAVSPKQEMNLLDKVSFMDSSIPNNTLMATGASLADLPLEDDSVSGKLEKKEEADEDVKGDADEAGEEAPDREQVAGKLSALEEEVDKILEEVKSSERGYSSDQFDTDDESPDDRSSDKKPEHLVLNPANNYLSPDKTTDVNPFESTPIYSDRLNQSAGFDLSPVMRGASGNKTEETNQETRLTHETNKETHLSQDTVSTTNPDYSQEKDMAYYLAKIKAKAAKKSQELRSSLESSRASESKSEKTPEFVKPKTPPPKKRTVTKKPVTSVKKPASAISKKEVAGVKGKVPLRTPRTKVVVQSPVAAYIKRGGKTKDIQPNTGKAKATVPKHELGSTWTCALSDRSLVEVIQSDGDVEAWKELYKRAQVELAQVQQQLQDMDQAHKDRIRTLKTAHSQELHKYKQEVYVLQSRLKSSTGPGAAGAAGVDDRVSGLTKQISELEILLAGYQTENVKLYEEGRVMKEHQKEEQTRLYLENKGLATNNVALKQLLEQKESSVRQLQQKQQSLTLAEKVNNLPKLVALQTELDGYKEREILFKQRIGALEGTGTGTIRHFSDAAVNSSLVDVDNQITSLIKEHSQEREDLYTKLETLLRENSQLKTDQDLLRRRDERITELQHTVRTLQSAEHEKQLVAAATSERNRTISDLKRQVSELESALHKRHPDSIAALIAAAQPTDYSNKLQEMQENLEWVKSEYEKHIAKLSSADKCSETELNKVQQMNRVLREKVARLEENATEMSAHATQLQQENKDIREGQIPTGEIKRRMEELNEKLQIQDEEMMQLKSRLLLAAAAPPTRQYDPEQFEGRHISEIRKENTILKTKCDLLKIENDQNKSTLLGMRVQQETNAMKMSEEHNLKIDKLIAHHEGERQKMITQHAARFAESEVSKMKSKVETLELQVSHYSDLAGQLPKAKSEVEKLRNKEEVLVEQITKLGRELEETAAQQSPSIHQYKTIQHKVSNMEQKHKTQLAALQHTIDIMEKEKVKVVIADEHIIKKYKEQLISKNLQIERFQSEIDSIISLCMELQVHGIVLPNRQQLASISKTTGY